MSKYKLPLDVLDEVQQAWELADEEVLTPGGICHIAWQIRDGNHDPMQARRLLKHFLEVTERGRPDQKVLPEPLLQFLRDAFTGYLHDPRKGRLEKLLGLVAPDKRPQKKEKDHHHIAWAVLRERLNGKSLLSATMTVSKEWGISQRRTEDIWAMHKGFALDLQMVSRAMDSAEGKAGWSDKEKARLQKIYPKLGKILNRSGKP
jgi:hypothetical protein